MTENVIKEKSHLRNHWGFYMLLGLSLAAIGYVWFSAQYSRHKMVADHKVELRALQSKTDSLLQVSINQSRVLTAKTMGQAVSNMSSEEKSQYFDQMIKYKGISEVLFENDSKVIQASSNAKYLKYSVVNALDIKINYQNTDTQSFYKKSLNIIAHPVIRDGKIDGTLVLVFPSISVAQL